HLEAAVADGQAQRGAGPPRMHVEAVRFPRRGERGPHAAWQVLRQGDAEPRREPRGTKAEVGREVEVGSAPPWERDPRPDGAVAVEEARSGSRTQQQTQLVLT